MKCKRWIAEYKQTPMQTARTQSRNINTSYGQAGWGGWGHHAPLIHWYQPEVLLPNVLSVRPCCNTVKTLTTQLRVEKWAETEQAVTNSFVAASSQSWKPAARTVLWNHWNPTMTIALEVCNTNRSEANHTHFTQTSRILSFMNSLLWSILKSSSCIETEPVARSFVSVTDNHAHIMRGKPSTIHTVNTTRKKGHSAHVVKRTRLP